MTPNNPEVIQRRGRRRFLLLAALFAAPFVLAWLYIGVFGGWRPDASVNYGTLIEPARPLDLLALPRLAGKPPFAMTDWRRHWTLVYIAGDGCAAPCRENLYTTRQVRLTLGKDAARVQRVLLLAGAVADPEFYAAQHPQLIVLPLAEENRAAVLRQFMVSGASNDYLVLVDPLGNAMMWYPANVAPDALDADLKRLLKYSQIG